MLSVVVVLVLLSSIPFAVLEEGEYGRCICAVFPEGQTHQDPIIQHSLELPMPCNEEGVEICDRLCFALAETAREKAPAMICEVLNEHVDHLTVMMYTKVCNTTSWKGSGVEGTKPICCHDGKTRTCDFQENFTSISNNI